MTTDNDGLMEIDLTDTERADGAGSERVRRDRATGV